MLHTCHRTSCAHQTSYPSHCQSQSPLFWLSSWPSFFGTLRPLQLCRADCLSLLNVDSSPKCIHWQP
jgi:hypothetical protein